MKQGMTILELLEEVQRQQGAKRDFVADTREHMQVVPMPGEGFEHDIALVLHRPESRELERFEMTDHFHKQLASRLQIPAKYYFRLMADHRELLLTNINELLNREPEVRLVRTLDGRARAFLSRQYRRLDNDTILEQTLPTIRHEYPTQVLATNVDENRMRFKCLFTGDEHQTQIGVRPRDGQPDIVQAGFEMSNSETGAGSLQVRGFFYRSFCLNGCVFGTQETVSFRRTHIGSKLDVDAGMLLSQETLRKEDELIVAQVGDVLKQLSSPQFVQEMGRRLRALREGQAVKNPHAAVELIGKELQLTQRESEGVLESFIRDRDYSQWGMLNAVTEQANTAQSFERASELEEAGNRIINLNSAMWRRVAEAEPVAA